ncbi:hypothetical protein AVEN_102940-1, partial [Araneus ventricosus]
DVYRSVTYCYSLSTGFRPACNDPLVVIEEQLDHFAGDLAQNRSYRELPAAADISMRESQYYM